MKKLSFLAGVLTTALIGGLAVSALAATGAVTFNTSALQFNGTQISAKGEDYTLANGCLAPSSITYTDEKGGGTTYLPVRRIGELMGVETGWDGATGSVTVKGPVKAPATPEAPLPADYSDWTAEEEKAYGEFRGMWEVTLRYTADGGGVYDAHYTGPLSDDELSTEKQEPQFMACAERMAMEYCTDGADVYMVFYGSGPGIGSILISDGTLSKRYFPK